MFVKPPGLVAGSGEGGGLDEAVEPAGEGALEASADVAVGLALGGASGFVVAGFGVAAEPGDRDGVQGAVEVSVAHSAEPVPGALAAAGFERRDAGEGCECGFVADASAVGPADQQLGGDDRSDTGFGEQSRAGRVLRDEDQQLGVQFGGLGDEEPDPGGDRPQRQDRDPMLDGGSGWAGEPSIRSSCLASAGRAAGSQMLGGDDDQTLQFVDRFSPAHQDALSGDQYLPKRLPESAVTRSGLFGLGERCPGGLDGVDPVVLGAARALVVPDLNDVFTRLG